MEVSEDMNGVSLIDQGQQVTISEETMTEVDIQTYRKHRAALEQKNKKRHQIRLRHNPTDSNSLQTTLNNHKLLTGEEGFEEFPLTLQPKLYFMKGGSSGPNKTSHSSQGGMKMLHHLSSYQSTIKSTTQTLMPPHLPQPMPFTNPSVQFQHRQAIEKVQNVKKALNAQISDPQSRNYHLNKMGESDYYHCSFEDYTQELQKKARQSLINMYEKQDDMASVLGVEKRSSSMAQVARLSPSQMQQEPGSNFTTLTHKKNSRSISTIDYQQKQWQQPRQQHQHQQDQQSTSSMSIYAHPKQVSLPPLQQHGGRIVGQNPIAFRSNSIMAKRTSVVNKGGGLSKAKIRRSSQNASSGNTLAVDLQDNYFLKPTRQSRFIEQTLKITDIVKRQLKLENYHRSMRENYLNNRSYQSIEDSLMDDRLVGQIQGGVNSGGGERNTSFEVDNSYSDLNSSLVGAGAGADPQYSLNLKSSYNPSPSAAKKNQANIGTDTQNDLKMSIDTNALHQQALRGSSESNFKLIKTLQRSVDKSGVTKNVTLTSSTIKHINQTRFDFPAVVASVANHNLDSNLELEPPVTAYGERRGSLGYNSSNGESESIPRSSQSPSVVMMQSLRHRQKMIHLMHKTGISMATGDLKGDKSDKGRHLGEQQDLICSKVQFSSKETTSMKQLASQTQGQSKVFLRASKKTRTSKKKKEQFDKNSDYDQVLNRSIRVAGVGSRSRSEMETETVFGYNMGGGQSGVANAASGPNTTQYMSSTMGGKSPNRTMTSAQRAAAAAQDNAGINLDIQKIQTEYMDPQKVTNFAEQRKSHEDGLSTLSMVGEKMLQSVDASPRLSSSYEMANKQNQSAQMLSGRQKKVSITAKSVEARLGEDDDDETTVVEQFQAMSNELIDIISQSDEDMTNIEMMRGEAPFVQTFNQGLHKKPFGGEGLEQSEYSLPVTAQDNQHYLLKNKNPQSNLMQQNQQIVTRDQENPNMVQNDDSKVELDKDPYQLMSKRSDKESRPVKTVIVLENTQSNVFEVSSGGSVRNDDGLDTSPLPTHNTERDSANQLKIQAAQSLTTTKGNATEMTRRGIEDANIIKVVVDEDYGEARIIADGAPQVNANLRVETQTSEGGGVIVSLIVPSGTAGNSGGPGTTQPRHSQPTSGTETAGFQLAEKRENVSRNSSFSKVKITIRKSDDFSIAPQAAVAIQNQQQQQTAEELDIKKLSPTQINTKLIQYPQSPNHKIKRTLKKQHLRGSPKQQRNSDFDQLMVMNGTVTDSNPMPLIINQVQGRKFKKQRLSVDMNEQQAKMQTTAMREHELYGGTLQGSELRGFTLQASRMGISFAHSLNKDKSVMNSQDELQLMDNTIDNNYGTTYGGAKELPKVGGAGGGRAKASAAQKKGLRLVSMAASQKCSDEAYEQKYLQTFEFQTPTSTSIQGDHQSKGTTNPNNVSKEYTVRPSNRYKTLTTSGQQLKKIGRVEVDSAMKNDNQQQQLRLDGKMAKRQNVSDLMHLGVTEKTPKDKVVRNIQVRDERIQLRTTDENLPTTLHKLKQTTQSPTGGDQSPYPLNNNDHFDSKDSIKVSQITKWEHNSLISSTDIIDIIAGSPRHKETNGAVEQDDHIQTPYQESLLKMYTKEAEGSTENLTLPRNRSTHEIVTAKNLIQNIVHPHPQQQTHITAETLRNPPVVQEKSLVNLQSNPSYDQFVQSDSQVAYEPSISQMSREEIRNSSSLMTLNEPTIQTQIIKQVQHQKMTSTIAEDRIRIYSKYEEGDTYRTRQIPVTSKQSHSRSIQAYDSNSRSRLGREMKQQATQSNSPDRSQSLDTSQTGTSQQANSGAQGQRNKSFNAYAQRQKSIKMVQSMVRGQRRRVF